jgi:hypothetical protein
MSFPNDGDDANDAKSPTLQGEARLMIEIVRAVADREWSVMMVIPFARRNGANRLRLLRCSD